jgi:enoyl-[acyl-carrier protein] reductase I
MPTRAASGIPGFDELVADARERAPIERAITLEDVGTLAAFLVSDAAQSITGGTLYVDNGFHILA